MKCARFPAVLAILLLAGCGQQKTKPEGPPPPERAHNIFAVVELDRVVRARNRATTERGRADETNLYHVAKADAWLDFAGDTRRDEGSEDTAEAALDRAEVLLSDLEQGKPPYLRTLHVIASVKVRNDLWGLVDGMKDSAGFRCAGEPLAKAEVALVWAGHKTFLGDKKGADEIAARAEGFIEAARGEFRRCLAADAPAPAAPATSTPAALPVPSPALLEAATALAPAAARTEAPTQVPGPGQHAAGPRLPGAEHIEIVQLRTDALFPFGAKRLDAARSGSLRSLAQRIRSIPDIVSVRIHGYTDRLSLSGAGFNRRLSEARARAVGDALVAHGVDPALIDARGHGDILPVVECPGPRNEATIACLAPNRRVEIEIERKH